jgi:hypothetical protein
MRAVAGRNRREVTSEVGEELIEKRFRNHMDLKGVFDA